MLFRTWPGLTCTQYSRGPTSSAATLHLSSDMLLLKGYQPNSCFCDQRIADKTRSHVSIPKLKLLLSLLRYMVWGFFCPFALVWFDVKELAVSPIITAPARRHHHYYDLRHHPTAIIIIIRILDVNRFPKGPIAFMFFLLASCDAHFLSDWNAFLVYGIDMTLGDIALVHFQFHFFSSFRINHRLSSFNVNNAVNGFLLQIKRADFLFTVWLIWLPSDCHRFWSGAPVVDRDQSPGFLPLTFSLCTHISQNYRTFPKSQPL